MRLMPDYHALKRHLNFAIHFFDFGHTLQFEQEEPCLT
jgi:hypothetical protein